MPPLLRWLLQLLAIPFFVIATVVVWGFVYFAARSGPTSFAPEGKRATRRLWLRWWNLLREDEDADHRFE